MPTIYKAIRAALGAAFLGDTYLAKALPLSSPDVFDDRLISFLAGLQQTIEPKPGTAINGVDIRNLFAALDATSNANRIAKLSAAVAFPASFSSDSAIASGCVALGAGPGLTDIVDNVNSELRIAKLGPKVWALQVSSAFGTGTAIAASGTAMEWWFHSSKFEDASGVFPEFYAAMDGMPYMPFGSFTWRAPDGSSYSSPLLCQVDDGGPMGVKGLRVWAVRGIRAPTSDADSIYSQLSVYGSGQVILP